MLVKITVTEFVLLFQYYRFSVGGMTDVAEIKGHRCVKFGSTSVSQRNVLHWLNIKPRFEITFTTLVVGVEHTVVRAMWRGPGVSSLGKL